LTASYRDLPTRSFSCAAVVVRDSEMYHEHLSAIRSHTVVRESSRVSLACAWRMARRAVEHAQCRSPKSRR
jgi:DNA-directed RNA polymerase subunit N (RpoN/RPB10)